MSTDDHITFVGAAAVLREHGFDLLADEITTLWTASRATVTGQATRIMELEAERDDLYRALNPPEVAAPSPVVDRETLARIAHGPQVPLTPISGIPSPWQAVEQALDRLISAGCVRTPAAQPDRSSLQVLIARAINGSADKALHRFGDRAYDAVDALLARYDIRERGTAA